MADKNEQHNHKPSVGQNAADKIASIVGSWKFILFQSVFFFFWIFLNVTGIISWDSHPFIFLTLILSVQAAYAAPIILMSQNRAEERDRKKFEIDLATDRKAEREIKEIKKQLNRVENDKIKRILEILEKK